MDRNRLLSFDEAQSEANRCLGCFDAPCRKGCPASVDVKHFIRRIAQNNVDGAYEILLRDNPFSLMCGYVCADEIQCKAKCTLSNTGNPIKIRELQLFASYYGSLPKNKSVTNSKYNIGIIGSGPAGLSCAYYLKKNGIKVTLFEKEKKTGGIPVREIPDIRLPKAAIKKELSFITRQIDRKFHLKEIKEIKSLVDKFDAIYIAVGNNKNSQIQFNNNSNIPIIDAHLFLKNKAKMSKRKDVIIVGGGNSAIDAAISAIVAKAKSVTVIYRRSENEMPSWEKERTLAKKMGVDIRSFTIPVKSIKKNGKKIVECRLTIPGKIDKSSRRTPVIQKESKLLLPVDIIVSAIGDEPSSDLFKSWGLAVDDRGFIKVDGNYKTSAKKVWAGGDCVGNDNRVVNAVSAGKKSADSIYKTLLKNPVMEFNQVNDDRLSLSVTFCNVKFENPFVLAAAPPTDELDMLKDGLARGWSGAVLKTTSIDKGSIPLKYPMMSGIKNGFGKLVSMGNIDLISAYHIDQIEKRITELKKSFPKKVIIGSMMGETETDWSGLAKRLSDAGADIIECSFSCPQGTLGSKPGFMLGQDPALVEKVTSWVKKGAGKTPVVIKITPQVADIIEVGLAVKNGGGDALCASNTIPSLMGINLDSSVPYPDVRGKTTFSGLSGTAIRPVSLRNIAILAKEVGLPITGTGGISTWSDAVEFLSVGVSTLQFCTEVMLKGFDIIDDLVDGLSRYLSKSKFNSVQDLIGRSLSHITTHDLLDGSGKVRSEVDKKLCIGCGCCYIACFDGGHRAIFFDNKRRSISIDHEKCVGCGLCLLVAPVTGCLKLVDLNR